MIGKNFDTVIIGAGISGLACAKRLQDYGKDFLIISENIGGRILTSKDRNANYGAFFVCSDYHNVNQYVTLGPKIRLRDFCFHDNSSKYVLFEPKLLSYTLQFLKVMKILYKFRKAFRKFRIKSENISQKKAIENDPFLYDLYMTNAVDFVKKQGIQSGTETYLSKALYSTTFSNISELNAFSFLQFLLPLITPIYTFTFEKEKMTESFNHKILLDRVESIEYKNQKYLIKLKKSKISTKNLVLATEINWSKKIAGIKKTNKPVSTHMYHIKGTPKDVISKKRYHLFSSNNNVQAVADLKDGTYLFYYKEKKPSLDKYFSKFEIIDSHFWNPAGTINGHELIETNRGNNMYLIGDFNIAGLEESYITGLYCANQIIKSD
ncbi:hypothetical protein AYK24_05780 [Thermoplasmatales archaeon SG8-52-4]|nr:MAG: hypothetical protein AYK24_05780 [Thermoplasmatales archaeon SG8-52-4]